MEENLLSFIHRLSGASCFEMTTLFLESLVQRLVQFEPSFHISTQENGQGDHRVDRRLWVYALTLLALSTPQGSTAAYLIQIDRHRLQQGLQKTTLAPWPLPNHTARLLLLHVLCESVHGLLADESFGRSMAIQDKASARSLDMFREKPKIASSHPQCQRKIRECSQWTHHTLSQNTHVPLMIFQIL